MINLSELVTDPDFAQPLTINRSTGAFALGGWQQGTPAPIPIIGVVTVAKERELAQVPEGDQVEGAMLFYSLQQLFLSKGAPDARTSDTITWRGDVYRLAQVWPYADFGYWKALGVRISGD